MFPSLYSITELLVDYLMTSRKEDNINVRYFHIV